MVSQRRPGNWFNDAALFIRVPGFFSLMDSPVSSQQHFFCVGLHQGKKKVENMYLFRAWKAYGSSFYKSQQKPG